MSWDIVVQASELRPPPVEHMPDEWDFRPLGSASEVRSMLSAVLPDIRWSDPRWGVLDSERYSYEFNMGREDPIPRFMVHVRGSGDAVSPLLRLSQAYGWYLLDCFAGEWMHHMDDEQAGWVGFQAYRDQILGEADAND